MKKIELLNLTVPYYLCFGGEETLASLAVKLEFITNK